MSGIINSAGSRSGVIGTTELDYEEGDLDPTTYFLVGGSAVDISSGAQTTGSYVKIGEICYLSYLINTSSINLGTGTITLALPFTASAKQWSRAFAIVYEGGGAGWIAPAQGYIADNATALSVYEDLASTAFTSSTTNQRNIYCSITYRVV